VLAKRVALQDHELKEIKEEIRRVKNNKTNRVGLEDLKKRISFFGEIANRTVSRLHSLIKDLDEIKRLHPNLKI